MTATRPPVLQYREKYFRNLHSTPRKSLTKQLMSREKKSNIILRMQRAQYLFENSFYPDNPTVKKITTLETHTAGQPLRVIVDGLPDCPQGTALEKRNYFSRKHDYIRKALLQEPRGHVDQYGAILTIPEDDNNSNNNNNNEEAMDLDVVFLNTKGYSPMCGHGILAITKIYLEMGCGRPSRDTLTNPIKWAVMGTPAGRILAYGNLVNGMVDRTYFHNVPSFVYLRDVTIELQGLGTIKLDICYGGAFFAIVDVSSLPMDAPPSLTPSSSAELISLQRKIKAAITSSDNIKITHPTEPAMSSLFGVMFVGPALSTSSGHHSRNVSIYEDGIVDRSPCGTGVSARAALLHAKGELQIGERIVIESIVGSTMTVEVMATTKLGGLDAVIPEVGGKAHVTGKAEWWIEPSDRIGDGFILG